MKKEYIRISLDQIIPYENNPRKNDEAVPYVQESIKQVGYISPIIIDENNVILAGHTRAKALKESGESQIDVIRVSGLTEEQKKKYRLLDNKTNEFAEWDFDTLEEELNGLDFEGFDFDFNLDDVVIDNTQTTEDDYDYIETQEQPMTNVGDLYQLGEHRLICGDCTDAEVATRLMNGDTAKLLFTSPPYSDIREYNGGKDLSVDKLINFISVFRKYTNYQCVNLGIQRKDNDIVQYWDKYIAKAKEAGYKLLSWNVWDKGMSGNIGQASAMFPLCHEWIFVFGTEFYEINLTIPKKPENITDNMSPKTKRNKDGTTSYHTIGDTSKPYKQMESVLHLHPELDNKVRKLHPATFPVGLPSEYIKAMTVENDGVIEPFGGSGTTLIACEQLNRKCYMCELDPRYVDVIVKRYESFTGKKAELLERA